MDLYDFNKNGGAAAIITEASVLIWFQQELAGGYANIDGPSRDSDLHQV